MKEKIFTFCVCCFATSGFALAQQSLQDTIHLKEVTVTSDKISPSTGTSKVAAPVKEIPIAITSVSNVQIHDLNFTNLVQATRNVPGVRPMRTYGAFQRFYMRGFSNFVVLNDGMRDERHTLYSSAPSSTLASVERIEVLKGASSLTVGHSALGGVINVIHKKPTSQTHANASASIGSWGTYSVAAGAGGAITDKLLFRADVSAGYGEGWRHTQERFFNAYLALDYKINTRNLLSFSVNTNDDMYRGDYGQPHLSHDVYDMAGKLAFRKGDLPAAPGRRTIYSDPKDHLGHKNVTTMAKWTHHFDNPDWVLTEYCSFFHDDIDYYASESLKYLTSDKPIYKHYYLNKDKKVYISLDSIERGGFNFAYKTELVQNQLELAGKAKWGATVHNLLGGYAFSYIYIPRYKASYATDASGPGKYAHLPLVNPELNQGFIHMPHTSVRLDREYIHGLYLQDYMRWGKLAVLGGLRVDFYNRIARLAKTEDKKILSKGPQDHTHNTALSYRIGLLYDITSDFNVYASTSNFFKPTRVAAAQDYVYIDNKGKVIDPSGKNVFKPESAVQYEVGAHYAKGTKFQANFATYYILKDNMVVNLGKTADGKRVSGQVGRAESKGVEFDLTYAPCEALEFNAGYALTVAKLKSYVRNDYAENVSAGNYLDRVPKNTAFGWAFYNLPLCKISKIRMGCGVEYSDKVYADVSNTLHFPAYTLMHAMVNYKRDNWKLQLNVNNIFDKTYYVTSVNSTGFIPEPGRNFTVSASYEF
ncbi:TonB-dependent receptor [Porphyromonas pogonae]|uniref:TonB-dependent receptor n=1 Tax=Porphyromonas pogonae TaxID=867595 RepID=UPI002E764892|nr:TonB-dependent receptor [Porphyromonas pogonae]